METEFNKKEQYWIDNLIHGEEILEQCKDSKSESWITEGYLDYLDLMIKYGNLRLPEIEYEPIKRVIKVNRIIPKKLLETGKYAFTIFNGVYIVQDVVFVKAEHCGALLNKQLNDNPKLDEHDLLISSFKTMVFENGEKWCVFLKKSGFTERHLGFYSSYWDYAYIYDDEHFGD